VRFVLDGRAIHDHFPGIGRYTFNLAAALPGALVPMHPQAHVTLLHHPRQPNSRFMVEALAATGVEIVPCEAANFSLAEQWRVPRMLARLRADLYHSPYLLMPYRPGRPTVVTIHDLIPLVLPQLFAARTRLLVRAALGLAVRASHRILTDSRSAADDLHQLLRVPRAKIAVVPAAAGPEFTPQPPDVVDRVRAHLGLPDRYVLYFGSNKPHKNLARLVRAYRGLPGSPPPLVIGGHWDAAHREARTAAEAGGAVARGRVRFVGQVTAADLPAVYSGALLFVFPSMYEGFGLPPLEAMACGAPVAASRASALPEVVGDAGWLFNPLDENDMARVLSAALAAPDELAHRRQLSLEQAARFSWAATARQTAAEYATALASAN
jgi:alpha-1,3-rhamnosyl/mannosyltransferase